MFSSIVLLHLRRINGNFDWIVFKSFIILLFQCEIDRLRSWNKSDDLIFNWFDWIAFNVVVWCLWLVEFDFEDKWRIPSHFFTSKFSLYLSLSHTFSLSRRLIIILIWSFHSMIKQPIYSIIFANRGIHTNKREAIDFKLDSM